MIKKTKVLTLGLICLLVLSFCKSPTDPKIEEILEQKNLPIIESFTATPSGLDYLQKSNLKWKVTNADKIEIDNGIGIVEVEGMKEIAPIETTIYILIATNDDGNAKQSCTVTCKEGYVYKYPNWPQISFGISNNTIHVYWQIVNRGWTPIYNLRAMVEMYLFGDIVATGETAICDKLEPHEQIYWEIIFYEK